MPLSGVWTSEVYGPFGWENRGILVIEKHRIIGGDNRHYSVGHYELSGDRMTATLNVHYYGPPRTQFGSASEQFSTEISGRLVGDTVEGVIRRPDKPQFDLQIRITKRMGIPGK
ncbi:MAG: hypothetical protein AAFX92_09290 [Pseudomonadota bacterium]